MFVLRFITYIYIVFICVCFGLIIMADDILVCFVIEHPIYNGWTGWYACLCKLCMSSVPIFLEEIRNYFCFYFYFSYNLKSYFRFLLK